MEKNTFFSYLQDIEMEEEDSEETETDIPHFIAHVPVPSQKEVGYDCIAVQKPQSELEIKRSADDNSEIKFLFFCVHKAYIVTPS